MRRHNQDELENELAEARSRLRFYERLFEAIPDPIYVKGERGVHRSNAAFESLVKLPREKMIGRSHDELFPREQANVFEERERIATRVGRDQNDEYVTDVNGTLHYITSHRASFTEGGARFVVSVLRDMTEAVTARATREQTLADSQARLDAVFRHVPAGIVVFDEHGEPSLATGQLLEDEPPVWWPKLLERVRLDQTSSEWQMLSADRAFDVRFERLLEAGGMAVIVDVTDQQRLQQRLREADKVDTMGRLAASIAHDFNNLIGIFMAAAENGTDALIEGAVDEVSEDLDAIRDASKRAAELTRRLLSFARRNVHERVTLDAHKQLTEMTSFLERLLGAGVELKVELTAESTQIEMDRALLQQVIMNLAVNARQAMNGQGELRIRTFGRSLNGEDALVIAVSDNGPGMEAETLRRALEPLFTTRSDGTGLGLATCAGVVQESGGTLTIESAVGEGTTIEVVLPICCEERARRSSYLEDLAAPHRPLRVLFVDDDRSVRRAIARSMKRRGYDVSTADGSEEAVALIERGEIDIVITDIVMPRVSGVSFARQVKDAVPVILTSGHLEDSVLRHNLEENEFPMIGKPFTPAELDVLIQNVVDAA